MGVPDQPGTSLAIFSKIAAKNDRGRHDRAERGRRRAWPTSRSPCSRTICRPRSRRSKQAAEELGAEGVTHDDDVAKVSVVGLGMATQTGVAERMFRALADAGINIQMITHQRNQDLGAGRPRARRPRRCGRCTRRSSSTKPPGDRVASAIAAAADAASDAVDIVARLQRMEELTIDDIALDETQARVTISGVPDRPGIAAAIFEAVADGGIFVDMIVQSNGREGKAKLSFTVPQIAVSSSACELLGELAKRLRLRPGHRQPAGGQALGLGHRHAQPHRRGDPHVPVRWPRRASTSR